MTRLTCSAFVLLMVSSLTIARQDQVFRTRVEGIRVDVLASDGGRPIAGLTRDDFDVRDNGVPQKIESAQIAGGVNVAVLLDVSFSVLDKGIQSLVAAAEASLGCLGPSDSAALLTFSQGTRLVMPMTRDVDAVRRAVRNEAALSPRRKGDGTAMWDAVFAASSVAVGQRARSVVLLLTDAGDNASWVFPLQPDDARWVREERAKSVDVLRSSGVVIDVVWLPRYLWSMSRRDGTSGHQSQTEPADLTGGVAFQADTKDLRARFATRLDVLRSGYVLTYLPRGVRQDDGWHKLTVRLKNRKGQVDARPGYFAGGSPAR